MRVSGVARRPLVGDLIDEGGPDTILTFGADGITLMSDERALNGASVSPRLVVELRWTLVSDGADWQFGTLGDALPGAELQMSTDQAWRLLSNNLGVERLATLTTTGDGEIIETLLRTRAIIGTPKLGDLGDTQP